MAVAILNLRPTQPTASVSTGSLLFDLAGSSQCDVLLVNSATPPVTVFAQRNTPGTQTDVSVPTLAADTYQLSTYDFVTLEIVTVPVVIRPYVEPVPGCTDPDADNYDPNATTDNGTCSYSPRLLLAEELPVLVANGRPVNVTLNSALIAGAVPSPADAFINLAELNGAVGVELLVNGYRLSSGPLLLASNFNDADSLTEALNSIPALAADYLIRLNQDDEVRLTARTPGTPYNLAITTSVPAAVAIVTLPGVNQYRSQGRAQWGCFVEVWCGAPQTNPSTFSDTYEDAYRDRYGLLIEDPTGPAAPQLAQRMELPYRADNVYTFDIAPALRQFTGHAYPQADGSCPDRLTSYFLRYGELYQAPGGIRRQHRVYQSGVAWALDAVEIVEDFVPGLRLLTRRPGPWRVLPNAPAATLLLDASFAGPPVTASRRAYDGSEQSTTLPTPPLAIVTQTTVPAYFSSFVSGRITYSSGIFGRALPSFNLVAGGHALTFANGQGGFDSYVFEGEREELTKRAAATYATATGTATRSATVPEAFRLNAQHLTRDEYLWLRRELGNSPAVWLETEDGPLALNVTALSPEADEVKAEYALAVDCEPCDQPALGLTN